MCTGAIQPALPPAATRYEFPAYRLQLSSGSNSFAWYGQVFFARVASPLNNVTASAIASIRMKAPDDATCGELLRDVILQLQLTKCSEFLNVVRLCS